MEPTDAVGDKEQAIYCFSRKGILKSPIEVKFVRQLLYEKLLALAQQGKRTVITDLRNEFQLVVAEVTLRVKKVLPDFRLVLVLPYYYGYWGGPQWMTTQLHRARMLYRLADDRYVQVPDKVLFHAGEMPSMQSNSRFLISLCSVVITCQAQHDKWVLDAAQDKELIQIYQEIQQRLQEYTRSPSFQQWPVAGDLISNQEIAKLLQNRRTVCLYFTPAFCGHNYHNYVRALQQVLMDILTKEVRDGATDLIIPLENICQIAAASTVLLLRKKFPYIRCIVLLPFPVAAPRLEWGDMWNRAAKDVYQKADIRGYFSPNTRAGIPSEFYLSFMQFVSVLYCAAHAGSGRNLKALSAARNCFVDIRDIAWGIQKEITYHMLELQFEAFYEYLREVSQSDLIINELQEKISGLPLKEQLLVIRKYFSGRDITIPFAVDNHLRILDQHKTYEIL